FLLKLSGLLLGEDGESEDELEESSNPSSNFFPNSSNLSSNRSAIVSKRPVEFPSSPDFFFLEEPLNKLNIANTTITTIKILSKIKSKKFIIFPPSEGMD